MTSPRAIVALRHISRAPEVLQCVRSFREWATLVPAYVGIRSMPLPLAVHTRSGTVLRLREFYDLETLWQIFCRRVYIVDPADRVVVDVGANIGMFTCYAANRATSATVHAVEPFPGTFERLVDTVRENGLDARVMCHAVALSSSAGVGTMSASAKASQMFHLEQGEAPAAGGAVVRTLTLSALLDSVGADVIDLLKMDIEGSEYDVLLSTPPDVLGRIRRVDLEFHKTPSPGTGPAILIRHLSAAGLRPAGAVDLAADYGMLHFVRVA